MLTNAEEVERTTGGVSSAREPYTLSAEHINYDPRSQTIRLKGNARMMSRQSQVAADSIIIYVGTKDSVLIKIEDKSSQLPPTLTDLGNGVAVPTQSIEDYAKRHNISFKEALIRIKKESELYFFPLSPIPHGRGIDDIPERDLHIEPSPLNEELRPR